jgi:hypothetical protein
MGLDIYLYTREQFEANERHDLASNAFYEWDDYDSLSDDERNRLSAEIPEYKHYEDVPSARYPDHLFNRRYLRSSYNDGGFNRAVPDLTGTDHGLYWIFAPLGREWDGDSGVLITDDLPRLREAQKRAEQVVGELLSCDPIRVLSETPVLGEREHMWSSLPDEDQVLAWYRDEKAQHGSRGDDGGYSNDKGLVLGFSRGLEVLAVTLGVDLLGRPAAILVYRQEKESLDSYVQSAEIVVEFCDEAVALVERDGSAQMVWSG